MNDSSPTVVNASDIDNAMQRVAPHLPATPCRRSLSLSQLTGSTVYCKFDCLQPTGSFKERGVVNALLQLDDEQKSHGVVAASAGNHALALAYHGRELGIAVTVVMPVYAPLIKVNACIRFGADVILHGQSFGDAVQHARGLESEKHFTYVHGFNDSAIIAGQGTMGLELLEQVKDLDAVIIPVGGGGLIAGVGVAIKAVRPEVRIIGVEAARMPSFSAAREAGEPVTVEPQATLADGLAVGTVGANALATSERVIDEMILVEENDLALAVLRLLELEKSVVEGAGAAGLAALLSGQLPGLKGKRVAVPLCGGNIDPLVLRRVIEHGLAVDGRLCQMKLTISDRPGGLAKLTTLLAEAGVSVLDLRHERIFAGPNVSTVDVYLVIETRDRKHLQKVRERLDGAGYVVEGIGEVG